MLEQFRQLGYPEIEPVPDGIYRPKWSVMIPTYNCAVWLRETLKGVLAQDPGHEAMQIEVMDDASTKDDPAAVVHELGEGRVTFYRHPQNVGATANFNACLARSRGHLVQVLHGDDLVLPGFYQRMEELLDRNPGAGSAICRYATIDDKGVWCSISKVIQRDVGIAPGALPTIVAENSAQFAAVVLRRSLIEAVGGFHSHLIHASDWDLWKRAALHQSVAYESTILACYRVFEGNDTSRLIKTGANVADLGRAIDLSAKYLTSPESATWIQQARHFYADLARSAATQMLANGDYDSCRNQLRQACLLDPDFFWSRGHLQVHYWSLKKRLKRLYTAGEGSKKHLLPTAPAWRSQPAQLPNTKSRMLLTMRF